jgi:hypothetical protein
MQLSLSGFAALACSSGWACWWRGWSTEGPAMNEHVLG